MQQASWQNIKWGISPDKIRAISSLSLSVELDIKTEKSKDGTEKTTIKGVKPQALSINYETGFSAGVDPREEFEKLKKMTGSSGNFFIGGENLNTDFMLDEVSISNTLLDNTGRIWHASHTLNFNGGSKSASKKNASKTGKLTLSEKELKEAKSALGIGLTPAEKAKVKK